MDPDTLLRLLEVLNPDNQPGRMTLISRMGADHIATALAAADSGCTAGRSVSHLVVRPDARQYDRSRAPAIKRVPFSRILDEVRRFFAIHRAEGSIPGRDAF
jgi:3-deoxy-7-phosphoheptulonate synthase